MTRTHQETNDTTSTMASTTAYSRWDLISDLTEQSFATFADFARELVEKLVQTEEVLASGLWRQEAEPSRIILVADGGLDASPLVQESDLSQSHHDWMLAVFREQSPLRHRWERADDPSFGPFESIATPIELRGRCLAVLETIRYAHASHESDPGSDTELLQELKRLLQERWEEALPTPDEMQEESTPAPVTTQPTVVTKDVSSQPDTAASTEGEIAETRLDSVASTARLATSPRPASSQTAPSQPAATPMQTSAASPKSPTAVHPETTPASPPRQPTVAVNLADIAMKGVEEFIPPIAPFASSTIHAAQNSGLRVSSVNPVRPQGSPVPSPANGAAGVASPPGSRFTVNGGALPPADGSVPLAMPAITLNAPPGLGMKPGTLPAAAATLAQEAAQKESTRWKSLHALTMELQRSLSTRDVASMAANDGRQWLDCDRVTVLAGPRCRVVAVSGLARWSRRAPWLSLLEKLGRVTAAGKEPVVFPVDEGALAPEVAEPLSRYVAEAQPRALIAIPLVVRERPENEADDQKGTQRTVGCLVVEQLIRGETLDDLPVRAGLLATSLARPLDNAQHVDALWMLPVWRAVAKTRRWMRGRRLVGTLLALAILAAVATALVLVPWPYRVEADGQFVPSQRREVFAPLDSEVQEVFVRSGQRVQEGNRLLRLKNKELEVELVAARTELTEKQQLYRALQFQIDRSQKSGERAQELQLFGRLEETRAHLSGLTRRIGILTERQAQLDVRAPVAGTIATFQLDQLLQHRPVQRGDVLVTVMQDDGPWQLELKLEESRLGHLLSADKARHPLPVEYVLVTAPEQRHFAELNEIAARATLSDDDRLIVRLIAKPVGETQPVRRIGAEVRARIDCGQASLGYVLFGDIIEFVQRYVWW